MDEHQILMMKLAAKGYSCSQIIMQLALENRGEDNPALVRAMGGLAYGCGNGRVACGALTGACCVLALYAGKGSEAETASDRLPLMQNELVERFGSATAEKYGDITCEAITGENGPAAARERCGVLVADTFTLTMNILITNGFDPYEAG